MCISVTSQGFDQEAKTFFSGPSTKKSVKIKIEVLLRHLKFSQNVSHMINLRFAQNEIEVSNKIALERRLGGVHPTIVVLQLFRGEM